MSAHQTLKRKIQVQSAHAWDLENDIPWELGVNFEKDLLPSTSKEHIIPECTDQEATAFSQALGLITAAAIAEHEKILVEMKKDFYHDVLKRHDVCEDFKTLGEMFFEDEAKHSSAFNRYIDLYANHLNVTPEELRSILPIHQKGSLSSFLFKANASLGGMAFWWTVAITEEYSMAIYRLMRPMQKEIDPLYFAIHKLHYEEEVRHASFAQAMINLYRGHKASLWIKMLRKVDFVISDVIEKCWMMAQYKRFTKVSKYKDRHPFFQTLSIAMEKVNKMPLHKRLRVLMSNTDFLSLAIRPESHKNIQEEIKKSRALVFSFPKY